MCSVKAMEMFYCCLTRDGYFCWIFAEFNTNFKMSSDEDKPPAPPVRLTSNRGGERGDSITTVDMRPLPKGLFRCSPNERLFWTFCHPSVIHEWSDCSNCYICLLMHFMLYNTFSSNFAWILYLIFMWVLNKVYKIRIMYLDLSWLWVCSYKYPR